MMSFGHRGIGERAPVGWLDERAKPRAAVKAERLIDFIPARQMNPGALEMKELLGSNHQVGRLPENEDRHILRRRRDVLPIAQRFTAQEYAAAMSSANTAMGECDLHGRTMRREARAEREGG